MRRKEKEITDKDAILAVIEKSRVCRLGLSVDNRPYIVPLNFGYRDDVLYFHGALEGRKIDMLRENPQVCFEFDIDAGVQPAEKACQWAMHFQSVIGFGQASLVEDPAEKVLALEVIMAQYSGRAFTFGDATVRKTAVIRVAVDSMTGKQAGF